MIKQSFRLYLGVLILVAGVITGGRSAWNMTVKLGCLPTGGLGPPHSWLDNCDSDRIGDFAHSAVWFGLEPAVTSAWLKAKVLIFGDSRMLNAMSEFAPGNKANPTVLETATKVSDWFAAQHASYYILAFAYGEQSGWAERLVAKFQPHPAVMIFDTAPYFTGGLSSPAQAIETDPDGELKTALETQSFMAHAATYCGHLPWLCGRTSSNYRAVVDGHVYSPWPDRAWFGRRPVGSFPITPPPSTDKSRYEEYLGHARTLLHKVNIDPHCAVFTVIPNSDVDDSLAHFLADRLGGTFISPQLEGLASIDHWHLNLVSAQVWTTAFLDALQPVLKACTAPLQSSDITPTQ